MRSMRSLLVAFTLGLLASGAHAATAFNNLTSDANAGYAVFTGTTGWAQRFDVLQSGSITQVTFNLFKGASTSAFFNVYLLQDSGGLPTFTNSLFSQSLSDAQIPFSRPNSVTITPNAAVTANNVYWLALNISDSAQGSNYGWAYGPSTNAQLDTSTGSPAGSFKQAAYITGTGPWATSTFPTSAFGVKVEIVPEPSSAALGGVGLAVAAASAASSRRRRRRT